jgi:AraC-like DNA-binding protein
MLLRRDVFRELCQARERLCTLDDDLAAPSVEEVARQAAISPAHFIRQFEAVFGATPHQFRTHWRLDRAKRLLAAGHHSVTEACIELGFSSLGSFSDMFRRRVGVSPSAYQRRLRGLCQVPGTFARVLSPGCLTLLGRLPPEAFRSFREA